MKWWWQRNRDRAEVTDPTGEHADEAADEAVQEARDTTRRVRQITQAAQSSLRELEAHRRDNHILDAMLDTLGRGHR